MDFGEFRERAKKRGLAVDQHTFSGPMFQLMTHFGLLAIPAGRDALADLINFAMDERFQLSACISDLHASVSELKAKVSPVVWVPYDPLPGASPEMQAAVLGQLWVKVRAPEGRIFLKDWLA